MACCGGNVNVVTRGDADFTDASAQTDERKETDEEEEEISDDKKDVEETSV